MAAKGQASDVASLSFEEALGELERLVGRLEQGKGTLDEAIEAYQRGALLKKHCETKLNEAKEKVDKITHGTGGAVGSEPADIA
jgi:exodeoxyribonuclease VII small subunit